MSNEDDSKDNVVHKYLERIMDRLDHFEGKLDRQAEKQAEMNATLVRNTVGLEEHIRGVRALEQRADKHEARIQALETDEKIEKYAKTKIAGWATLAVGLGGTLVKFVEWCIVHLAVK